MNAAASSSAVPPISPMRTIPERHRILSNSEKLEQSINGMELCWLKKAYGDGIEKTNNLVKAFKCQKYQTYG